MIWDWIISAAQSPSFWKSLVGFAMAGGLQLAPDQQNAIISIGLAVMGGLNAWKHVDTVKSDNASK